MFLCVLEAGFFLAIFIAIVWFVIFIFSDADVQLILKTKFGKQPSSLSGKVVWITGASSGIGEHYAYCLAQSGCRLVLSARRKEELDRVKAACLAKSKVNEEDILVLPLDVVAFDSHKQFVQEVLEYFGKIDILINNAGKYQTSAWLDVDLDVDRQIYEVNVLGPVSLTQAVLPHMIERKEGQIAVVSSLAGKLGAPLSRSYVGAKHALQGYFDCLRTEMSCNNIDVTIICPGLVDSQILKNTASGKAGKDMKMKMNPLEKIMPTERCAYLSCVAIANRQYETWISLQPILLAFYFTVFVPDFGKWFVAKTAMKKTIAVRDDQ